MFIAVWVFSLDCGKGNHSLVVGLVLGVGFSLLASLVVEHALGHASFSSCGMGAPGFQF